MVGTGYVGSVTAAALSWLGHDVVAYDVDRNRVEQLSAGQVPFYEPGLDELIGERIAAGRLAFTAEPSVAVVGADVVFLCVGTPQGDDGHANLSQLRRAAATVADYLEDGAVIVNKSTVPVGCATWVRTLVEDRLARRGGISFEVVSNPEFLRQGKAVEDFLHPDRVVLGGCPRALQFMGELYRPLLEQSFPGGSPTEPPSLYCCDVNSAEMVKYAANAFLAAKISFGNEIANLCELVGADVRQVLPAVGADSRIGARYLDPGIGWGGSCLGKDVAALIGTAEEYGYNAALLRATVEVNDAQRATVLRILQRELRSLKGRRVAVLGLAFKSGTDDLRDSPSVEIIERLLAAGCSVSAYDPLVKDLPPELVAVRAASDIYSAAERADATVVATEWTDPIDFERLAGAMSGDVVIDGRNRLPDTPFLRVVKVGWAPRPGGRPAASG